MCVDVQRHFWRLWCSAQQGRQHSRFRSHQTSAACTSSRRARHFLGASSHLHLKALQAKLPAFLCCTGFPARSKTSTWPTPSATLASSASFGTTVAAGAPKAPTLLMVFLLTLRLHFGNCLDLFPLLVSHHHALSSADLRCFI